MLDWRVLRWRANVVAMAETNREDLTFLREVLEAADNRPPEEILRAIQITERLNPFPEELGVPRGKALGVPIGSLGPSYRSSESPDDLDASISWFERAIAAFRRIRDVTRWAIARLYQQPVDLSDFPEPQPTAEPDNVYFSIADRCRMYRGSSKFGTSCAPLLTS